MKADFTKEELGMIARSLLMRKDVLLGYNPKSNDKALSTPDHPIYKFNELYRKVYELWKQE